MRINKAHLNYNQHYPQSSWYRKLINTSWPIRFKYFTALWCNHICHNFVSWQLQDILGTFIYFQSFGRHLSKETGYNPDKRSEQLRVKGLSQRLQHWLSGNLGIWTHNLPSHQLWILTTEPPLLQSMTLCDSSNHGAQPHTYINYIPLIH